MKSIQLPYGKGHITANIPDERYNGSLVSKMTEYVPTKGQTELVKEALEHPIGTPKLSEMAIGKKKIVIISSDHTRPVPSKIIMPLLLEEVRKGNPDADITILISTGLHRETTKEELIGKFGEDIVKNEKIVIHDCDDKENLVDLGKLPSGGELIINKLAYEADLLVAEGFIEPHFFAGFSGGRKSILPGIASRVTVCYNHNADFIDSPFRLVYPYEIQIRLVGTGHFQALDIVSNHLWRAFILLGERDKLGHPLRHVAESRVEFAAPATDDLGAQAHRRTLSCRLQPLEETSPNLCRVGHRRVTIPEQQRQLRLLPKRLPITLNKLL